jgi:hypothetical protein
MEVFLSQHCGDEDIVAPIKPVEANHVARNCDGFFNHIYAHAVRTIVGKEVWDSYYKFCFERNPWDKTVSFFYFYNSCTEKKLSFQEFLADTNFSYYNYPRYTEDDKVIVDFVGKWENLVQDFSHVCRTLGLPFNGDLGSKAKSDTRKERRPYQSYFSDQQRKVIERVFAKEISLHGYTFD